MTYDVTVITPTMPGREQLLAECTEAVRALGIKQIVGLDTEHYGPAVVRNFLLEQVETEWVIFCDDDDILLPNYLDEVGPHMVEGNDLIYTSWELVGGNAPEPVLIFDPIALEAANYIPVTVTARTAAVRAVGGFPDWAFNEDHALWVHLMRAGYHFHVVPVVCWKYRRNHSTRAVTNRAPFGQ